MGLAAGQARLLSITARKSDCEYQSMRLSHQKIALSRQLADLSNEYENSLNQTKLVYDYYGTGDSTTPLSYNILMTPSALNDYMPVTITDSAGRVTLDSKYAAAARAAGIPQEGLGTLPSDSTRNKFIEGLYNNGLITETLAEKIQGLPYNQTAGFGGDITVANSTTTGDINDLISYLNNSTTSLYTLKVDETTSNGGDIAILTGENSPNLNWYENYTQSEDLNIADLLSTDTEDQVIIRFTSADDERIPSNQIEYINKNVIPNFLNWIEESLGSALIVDDATEEAFAMARDQIEQILFADFGDSLNENDTLYDKISSEGSAYNETDTNRDASVRNSVDYVGFVYSKNKKRKMRGRNSAGAINLNNIAQAFLTLFVKAMDGWSKTNSEGEEKYSVSLGKRGKDTDNRLVTDNELKYSYTYTINTGTSVSSDDLAQSTFYDALFNQICANGWTENDNINDSDYLQQMLQSGMLYVTKVKDDGYYYQGNYATDTYIKEISDDTAIAQAEAKYSTEKTKLNAKEEEIDLKMKNLDTEISSLTTEYDTVKNTISKNIEKSFKRYNA